MMFEKYLYIEFVLLFKKDMIEKFYLNLHNN